MIIFEQHKSDNGTTFEFDGNGELTVTRKADAYTSFVDKYLPAEVVRRPKRYVYKADTLPPGDVPAFLMREGDAGWLLASAYVVGNAIQVIIVKEVQP
jgi:hypothetical protein